MSEKKQKKWTAADLFLILLAVLSLLGFFVRFWGIRSRGEENLRDYVLTVEWKDVDARTVGSLQAGDLLYLASGERFGEVLSAEDEPSEVEVRQDGRIYRIPSTTRRDARITVAVKGREAKGQILGRSGDPVMIGQRLMLYSGTAEMSVRIASIAPKTPL